MNIYLIGYRGTGKTSVGKLLASKLTWPFVDTDSELTRQLGASIKEFVRQNGWAAFRDVEKNVVRKVSALDGHVIATGGGVVLAASNVERMQSSGTLIWLKALPETIKTRISMDRQSECTRPALTSEGLIGEIESMLKAREPHYHNAMDFFIDTDQIRINEICDNIIVRLSVKGADSDG
jgi:shikimate kinase